MGDGRGWEGMGREGFGMGGGGLRGRQLHVCRSLESGSSHCLDCTSPFIFREEKVNRLLIRLEMFYNLCVFPLREREGGRVYGNGSLLFTFFLFLSSQGILFTLQN